MRPHRLHSRSATLLVFWPLVVSGATRYDFTIIARTAVPIAGRATVQLGRGPSLNDAGNVAFVARDRQGGRGSVIVSDGDVMSRNFPIGSPFTAGDYLQINNRDQVVWYEWSDDGLLTYVKRLDTLDSGAIIATGSYTVWVESPFDELLPWVTLSNNGRVVFGAEMNLSDFTVLGTRTGGTGPYKISPALRGYPNLYPLLADNDMTVVRWGGDEQAPLIRIITPDLTAADFFAEATDFHAVGPAPGISDDGLVAAFVGHHKTRGLGVFVSVFTGDFTPVKVAGIPGDGVVDPPRAYVDRDGNGVRDPGEEDLGFFSNFTLAPRFGVNRAAAGTAYSLAFIAYGPAAAGQTGTLGLYTMHLDVATFIVTEPVLVLELGSALADVPGTVTDIRLYDPINTRGQLAFWIATSAGSQAIVRATPRSYLCRVQWSDGQPIRGARIEPYYFRENDLEIEPFPVAPEQVIRSGPDGTFPLPPELADAPPQPSEYVPGRYRGVRASITYTEITGGRSFGGEPAEAIQVVTNYPDWDPLRPFKKPTTAPLTITFPYPVFFQPGVTGRVNDNSADGKLRAFLTLDSGAPEPELRAISLRTGIALRELRNWQAVKHGMDGLARIPAFLYFGMPSGPNPSGDLSCAWVPTDDVPWGYNNCVLQSPAYINDSGERIREHFTDRIRPQLEPLTPGGTVRFAIVAHSLGGVITRNWLSRLNADVPIARYVTFDSPHGGVMLSNLLHWNFWSEQFMNGVTLLPSTPPPPPLRGWNYYRRLPALESYLMFSALNDPVITPEGPPGSAFGVGRIMMLPLKPWMAFLPSGYCERFVGGWLLPVYLERHGIQNVQRTFVSAARFLATGTRPILQNYIIDLPPTFEAEFGAGPVSICPLVKDGAPGSCVRYRLQAPAGGTTEEPLYCAAAGPLTLLGYATPGTARLIVRDAAGAEIPPAEDVTSPFDARSVVFTRRIPVTPGVHSLRLEAGETDSTALVTVIFPDAVHCGVGTERPRYDAGEQVVVTASLTGEDGAPVSGVFGTARAVVTGPTGPFTLELFDDGLHGDGAAGDGVFGALLAAPEPGRYGLSADVMIALGADILLRRQAEGIFFVVAHAARLIEVSSEQPVDTDGTGRWDAVEVRFAVEVAEEGEYALEAALLADGQSAGILRTPFAAAPGVLTVALRVPHETLFAHGEVAAFVLAAPELSDNVQALHLDSLPDHALQAYALADFDLPPAPAAVSVTPSFGDHAGGYDVVIGGTHLRHVTAVYFGSQLAPALTVNGADSLSVTVPVWDGRNDRIRLRLLTPWGKATAADLFEYAAALDQRVFTRGDPNGDGRMDLSDAIALLLHLFGGWDRIPCHKSADANDDGVLDTADAIFILAHLFAAGAPPSNPFPVCAIDPTPDALPCESYPPCLWSERRR